MLVLWHFWLVLSLCAELTLLQSSCGQYSAIAQSTSPGLGVVVVVVVVRPVPVYAVVVGGTHHVG